MKRQIAKLKQSEFALNSFKILSGTTIAQLFSVVMAPILYRIYDKEDYGVLGLFMAILGVVGVFSTLQYNQLILLVKTDEEANQAEKLNRIINLIFSLTTIPLIIVFGNKLAEYFNSPDLNTWLFLLPIQIFFSGQSEIFRVKANRMKKYSTLSMNTILSAFITPLVSLVLGFSIEGPFGLFLGLILGQLISTIYLQFKVKSVKILKISLSEFREMIKIAKRHYKFPLYSLPSELINRAGRQLPVFLIGYLSGESAVGVYNLCSRMLSLPVTLISGAVSEVFKKRVIDEYHAIGNCKKIFKNTAKMLLLIGVFPTILLLIFGPELFSYVFGNKWLEAGIYAQILSPMYLLQLIVSPLTYFYYLKEKLGEDLILHICYIGSLFLLFCIPPSYLSLIGTLIIFTIINCILYGIYFLRSFQLAR
jgi:O-antigen/teichoic acid export membrane protein